MTDTAAQATTPKRVLVIQAHPDDVEFGSAGTVAKWLAEGAHVTYCTITSGDKGSDNPEMSPEKLIATRKAEQEEACRILGVQETIFLGYSDASLVADLTLRRDLTRVMRQVQPDAIMTFDPTARYFDGYINHPDHIATGEASLAAVFPSVRDRLTFPELLAEGLEPHKVPEVYLYATDRANCWIDVTATMDLRIRALKAHASQLGDWNPDEEMRKWGRETAESNPGRSENDGEYAERYRYIKLD